MKSTQSDKNLDFNGMKGDGVNRAANRLAGNKWGGVAKPEKLINEGRGPTKGNQCYDGITGPSATKDAKRYPPHTSQASGREYPRNVDAINYGRQERGQGGTQVKGYKNPDRINVSGYSMGDGKMEKGSRPVAPGSTEGINYGPKKQY
jgi:hypothetical protein